MAENKHQYNISFRCPNCGVIFERLIQKGVEALGRGGVCTNCGVKDGAPKVGQFKVIRQNEEHDNPHIPFNTPRM